jgi:hypothetical protein
MLRILYVNFYQDGYWLEEMTATLAWFSLHICLGLLAIVGCGGSVRQEALNTIARSAISYIVAKEVTKIHHWNEMNRLGLQFMTASLIGAFMT